jgi:TRAP-type C4-dicarboxylate transport system substrate-binding protein
VSRLNTEEVNSVQVDIVETRLLLGYHQHTIILGGVKMKRFPILFIAILVTASLIIGGCSTQLSSSPPPSTSAVTAGSKPATTSTAPPSTNVPSVSVPSSVTTSPSQVIEMRFSHHNPPQGWTTTQFLNPWAKKVEAATNGAVKITMYPAQSIASLADNYDATINNLAQLTWIPTPPYQGRFSLSEVITLPFLSLPSGTINGKKVGPAAVNSYILQELYETVPEVQKEWSQTKVMFLHGSDPFFLITKKPVKNINDVKGIKIAVLGSGPTLDMWKKLGASPLYMTAPSVYEAGQKGVMDAVAVNWANLGTYRYNEVFPYVTDMNSFVTIFGLVMNMDTWNKLPPEVQKQVMSVSGQAGAEFASNTAFGEDNKNDILSKIKASGSKIEIIPLDPGEQDKMKTLAGKPIWDEWVASMKGKGLAADKVLDAVLKLVDKYK